MNESKTDATGTPQTNGRTDAAINELRARHAAAVSDRKGPGKGGAQLGKIRGPYNKNPQPGPSAPEPAAPVPPSPTQESLNRKMALVWRTVGVSLALGTNDRVWMLSQDEEKLLGEAYGDLCAYFGIADTLAFKIIFCVGTTIGVFGIKAAQHSVHVAEEAAAAEKLKKNPESKGPEKKDEQPGGIHESKPGSI